MKRNSVIIGTLLSSLVATCLNASAETKIKQDLLNALAAESLKTVEVSANYAKEATVVIDEMQALLGQIKDGKPGQPISELMTVEQALKFGELSQKQKYYLASKIILSRRERDMRVLEDLIVLTANEFEWNKPLEDGTKNELFLGLIYTIDSELANKSAELDAIPRVNDEVESWLDALLKNISEDYASTLNSKANEFVENFKRRTGIEEVKAELLTPEEKKLYGAMKAAYQRLIKYMIRLHAFRCLYSAMTIDNKWRMEDVVTTNGNIEKVGIRLHQEVMTKWNPTAQLVMQLSWVINEKFPSRFAEEIENSDKEAKK